MKHNVNVLMMGVIKNLVLIPFFMTTIEQIGENIHMRIKILDFLVSFYHN